MDVQPRFNEETKHTVSVVTARIVRFHVMDEVLTEAANANVMSGILKPVVDWKKLQVVGRLGGDSYTFVDNNYDLTRPSGEVRK